MRFFVDYLVIGSGAAGLFFASKASQRGKVAVVAKRGRRESNTLYAQGGIAAVLDKKRDSLGSHVKDTLFSGAGLCHSDTVEGIVGEGEDVIRDLMELGARFTVDDQVATFCFDSSGETTMNTVVLQQPCQFLRITKVVDGNHFEFVGTGSQ